MGEKATLIMEYVRELYCAGYSDKEVEQKLRTLIFDEMSDQLGGDKILLCGPLERSFEEYCEKIGISEKEVTEKLLKKQQN